ncbi:MAG: sulfite exporter TauE/SafE family protein [Cyclobacteriaceae bacterium]|nr:sulfite exporter TauE/SafE family protein [Cyclobacteriaceae bacterium]
MEVFGYFASFGVGLILGMIGSGGSILSIPILVYLFSFDIVLSTAYSLFIVGITSLVGTVQRHRTQMVNFTVGIFFGIPSLTTIFITRKWIVPAIPDIIFQSEHFAFSKRFLLLGSLSCFMMLAALIMIVKKPYTREYLEGELNKGLVMLQGLFCGFLSGFVGIGGGFIIVPALVILAKLPFKSAVGTALFIIAVNSMVGFLGDALNYSIDWFFLLSIATLSVLGIIIGNLASRKLPTLQLRKSFGWFTLAMGVFILIREFSVL